jgi:excisionase family DNA binding protein
VSEEQTPMQLLTVHDIAKQLSLAESTVYRLIKAGAIKTTRMGRAIRVTQVQLNTFINSSMEN